MHILKLIELAPKGYDFTGLQPYLLSPYFLGKKTKRLLSHPKEWTFPEDGVLACPTPFCSFENTNVDGDIVPIMGSSLSEIFCYCFCIRELTPGDYEGLMLMGHVEDNLCQAFSIYRIENNSVMGRYDVKVYAMIEKLLQILHHNTTMGLISLPGRAKYWTTDNKKKFFKPRKVIYIDGTKTTRAYNNHPINWTSIWAVKGHWRHLHNPESVGRDRLGERTVKGFTWINNYEKGPGVLKS